MAMNFSRNFVTLRKRNNITQEKMAEKCGVSRVAVTKWESGSSLPEISKIEKIVEVFDITADELLFGEMEDPRVTMYSDGISLINDKLDEILSEIRKRDNNVNAYDLYCRFAENDFDEGLPIEAYTYLGSEEALKGNYTDALKYYEEAVIRGDVTSLFIVLKIYEDMIDMYAYDNSVEDIIETRLIQARKMQQYGKIIEAVLNKEQVFNSII